MVLLFMPLYLKDLDFSLAQIGFAMSCFGVGSFIGAWIGGKLTDIIGYYQVMFMSLFAAGVSFFLLWFVKDFYWICMAIIISSTLGDAFRPANYAAIKAYSKKENQTRSMSLVRLAINLGFSLGPFVGGMLAESYGFHWVFILDGVTCITAAFAMLIFLPNVSIEKNKEVEAKKKSIETREISVFENKRFMFFLASSFLLAIAFFQLFTTFSVFLHDQYQYSEGMVGKLMAFNGFLIALIEMPLVFKLEHLHRKMKMVAIGTLLFCLSFIFLGFKLIEYYGYATHWTVMAILTFLSFLGYLYILKMPKPVLR